MTASFALLGKTDSDVTHALRGIPWHFRHEAPAAALPPCAGWHASSLWLRRL